MIVVSILTLFILAISGITTIPFAVGLLTMGTVLFQKSWVFFLALGLGLFLDLISVRPLGYASLVLTIFVFLLMLYERKFETQTATFIFIATFLGSLVYLKIFGCQQILLQSLVSSLLTVLVSKFLWLRLGPRSEIT
jgi:cell shape-determining protein MreD